MPGPRKRPSSICRRWFRPDPGVGGRQHARRKAQCQAARRKKTQAKWCARNPDYATAYRIQQRSAQEQPLQALCLPSPLGRLPWDLAKDEFGAKGDDSIGAMGTLLLRSAKDQFRTYVLDPTRVCGPLPPGAPKDQCPPAAY